jgi:NADPH:quinone reductase-like Zn-dependent oxidoreductase
MKAIVYSEYGSPDVLHIEDIEKPVPEDNEIIIRVHAAEATKADCEIRSFHFAVIWFWLPFRIAMGLFKPKNNVLGGYFSGVVETVGKDVTKFKSGDEVFGSTQIKFGAYAEYLCLPDDFTIVPKPHNMSYVEAAAVPLGGLNALHFMTKANIQKGDKVLINGAGGSIGTFALQIAKTMGAEVSVVDSTIKEEVLRSIGADHFFDYTKEDFSKSDQTYDVIFNMVARSSYSKCIKLLKPAGQYLLGNPRVSDMLRSLFTSKFTSQIACFSFAGEKEQELLELKAMIEAGTIKSIIDKVYSAEQAAEAHRRVETEQRLGVVVINMENI